MDPSAVERVHYKFAILVFVAFLAVIWLSAWNQIHVQNVAGARLQLRAVETVRDAVQKGIRAKRSAPSVASYLNSLQAHDELRTVRRLLGDDLLRNALGEDPAPLDYALATTCAHLETQLQ